MQSTLTDNLDDAENGAPEVTSPLLLKDKADTPADGNGSQSGPDLSQPSPDSSDDGHDGVSACSYPLCLSLVCPDGYISL